MSPISKTPAVVIFWFGFNILIFPALSAAEPDLLKVQILGSGGPELTDKRASTSYLIWVNGKAKILVDSGPGSSFHFEQSGADFNDLDAILYTHFHVDHSSDLPAFIKASYFTGRDRDLILSGPTGNALMPSTKEFVEGLFGTQGIYRYLGEYFQPNAPSLYKVRPVNISSTGNKPAILKLPDSIQAKAISVHHGPIPALAWRIDIGDCSITVTGDTNNLDGKLESFALDSDLLIAHHAIPENAGSIARNLHMPPSTIGKIAAKSHIKKLLLSHRMTRTETVKAETLREIRKTYKGPIEFAEDMADYQPCAH